MSIGDEIVLEARKLSLNLNNKQILDDISFHLRKSETVIIMGKNAAGKTMLLKTLAGLFTPQEGGSIIFGKNIYDLKREELNELRKNIGYVFQKSGMFDSLTVAENVTFALARFTNKKPDELHNIAVDCLHRSGLKDAENKFPSELSGGMLKRAGLARAISMNPRLLLLDDPTAGLDPVLTDAIADLIIDLRESLQCAALVITHDLKFAYKLANRIGLLISGSLEGMLDVEEFRTTDKAAFEQFREGNLTGPIPIIG